MASVPVVLRRIRRARRDAKKPKSVGRYKHYEPEYERIFRDVDDLGGEEALDELGEWALSWTHRQKRLPTPATVRRRGREICEERGIEIPDGSPLLD